MEPDFSRNRLRNTKHKNHRSRLGDRRNSRFCIKSLWLCPQPANRRYGTGSEGIGSTPRNDPLEKSSVTRISICSRESADCELRGKFFHGDRPCRWARRINSTRLRAGRDPVRIISDASPDCSTGTLGQLFSSKSCVANGSMGL